MDSICRKIGEVIGDPALIQQDLAVVFREHYAMPLDFNNKLNYAPDWKPYADDPALFKKAFRASKIHLGVWKSSGKLFP